MAKWAKPLHLTFVFLTSGVLKGSISAYNTAKEFVKPTDFKSGRSNALWSLSLWFWIDECMQWVGTMCLNIIIPRLKAGFIVDAKGKWIPAVVAVATVKVLIFLSYKFSSIWTPVFLEYSTIIVNYWLLNYTACFYFNIDSGTGCQSFRLPLQL